MSNKNHTEPNTTTMNPLPTTAAEALAILADMTLLPFDKVDFEAFAGVESEKPLIGYTGSDDPFDGEDSLVVIIDGDDIQFIAPHLDDEHSEAPQYVTFTLVAKVY